MDVMKISKEMSNLEIADLLRAISASYLIKDAKKNKFRIIAYENAAAAVEHLTSEAKDLWDEGKLDDIPGVGPSITEHLGEIFKTGKSKHFEEVMSGIAPAVFELMKLPGVGPKTASKLSHELSIHEASGALGKLQKAISAGKIAPIEGFGETSQAEIGRSIEEAKRKTTRLLLPYAQRVASEVIVWMKKKDFVKDAQPLGSVRRKVATIGDVDIAVATDKPKEAMEHFVSYPHKKRVIEKGDRSASILVPPNIQVDMMVQPTEAFGSLLQHFTGSKHHNIVLREYALKHNMSLSEYGIKKNGKLIKVPTEEAFYKTLGMKYIPPELREDAGEIEAALKGDIPDLLELSDIKGDLQIHSNFDIETSHDLGTSTMEEIIEKGNELGYNYLAFTEHNPSKSKHTDEQIVDILKRKKEKVEKLNYSLVKTMKKGVKKVFNSLEIDILPDGSLPVSDSGMETLDFALVSIHSSFRGSRDQMTKRVLAALSHPKAKIFAHPTARKLNDREAVELDWPRIFDFCIKSDKWLEINGDPMRLDLPDFLVKDAVKAGVKLTLGTDSHHRDHMTNMEYGVYVARRGWATRENIINTRSLTELERMLK